MERILFLSEVVKPTKPDNEEVIWSSDFLILAVIILQIYFKRYILDITLFLHVYDKKDLICLVNK